MTLYLNESRRNPTTGRRERTGRLLQVGRGSSGRNEIVAVTDREGRVIEDLRETTTTATTQSPVMAQNPEPLPTPPPQTKSPIQSQQTTPAKAQAEATAAAVRNAQLNTQKTTATDKNQIRFAPANTEPSRTVLTAPKPRTPLQEIEKQAQEAEFEFTREAAKETTNPLEQAGRFSKATALYAPVTAAASAKAFINVFNINPNKNTLVQLSKGAAQLTKESIQQRSPAPFAQTLIIEPLTTNPARFGAEIATDIATGAGAARGADAITNAYIKAGLRETPASTVTGAPIYTQSTEESLRRFNTPTNGKVIVTTASPQPLQGDTAGAGRKGGLPEPLEDAGIYTAPKGSTNPAFLRINTRRSGFTLNPLSALKPRIPTVTEFEVQQVLRQPRTVLETPGFKASREFLELQAGTGNVFITKRSEIAQGTAPATQFTSTETFTSPIPRTVNRNGQRMTTTEIRRGDTLSPGGTREIEAVIPPGARFATLQPRNTVQTLKGFDEFTTINGRAVAIRRVELITDTPTRKAPADAIDALRSRDNKLLKQIREESQDLSRRADNPPRNPVVFTQSSTPELQTPASAALSTPRRTTSRSGGSAPRINPAPSAPTPSTPSNPLSPSTPRRTASAIPALPSPAPRQTTPATIFKFPALPRPTPNNRPAGTFAEGFNVLVRRRGVFQKVNTEPLTQADAFSLGAGVVQNTAAATFKITRAGATATRRAATGTKGTSFGIKKGKKAGEFVQENRFRIGSVGEKQEITFKGIRASRERRRT